MADVQVTDNRDALRFEARIDGELAGFAAYELADDLIMFTHTEVFDAFEGQLFNITRAHMLPDLLGAAKDSPEVKRWGDRLLAVFLVGGTVGGVLFGSLADRIGRRPTMALTILFYSVFSGLTYFATELWQVAVLRFLVALGVFFPVYLNTFHGIRGVDRDLIEMARSYGLRGGALYRRVILPGATASILVGLRFSLGLMWVLLIVAETISAQSGIGYMTMNAREFLQTDVVLVGILIYALLGKLADVAAQALERAWLRWHPGYQT